jgi:hypothetical protein
LSKKIASSFVSSGIIPHEEQEVYTYSFDILLATLLNFFAFCLLAVVTGAMIETVFYLLAFLSTPLLWFPVI